jgi:hypothetical protein
MSGEFAAGREGLLADPAVVANRLQKQSVFSIGYLDRFTFLMSFY